MRVSRTHRSVVGRTRTRGATVVGLSTDGISAPIPRRCRARHGFRVGDGEAPVHGSLSLSDSPSLRCPTSHSALRAALILLAALSLGACAGRGATNRAEDGRQGAIAGVAAANPMAVDAGLAVLEAGGSAVDAAVAARIPFTPMDKVFNAMPVFHAFGLTAGDNTAEGQVNPTGRQVREGDGLL